MRWASVLRVLGNCWGLNGVKCLHVRRDNGVIWSGIVFLIWAWKQQRGIWNCASNVGESWVKQVLVVRQDSYDHPLERRGLYSQSIVNQGNPVGRCVGVDPRRVCTTYEESAKWNPLIQHQSALNCRSRAWRCPLETNQTPSDCRAGIPLGGWVWTVRGKLRHQWLGKSTTTTQLRI